jgi:hypothetical protein
MGQSSRLDQAERLMVYGGLLPDPRMESLNVGSKARGATRWETVEPFDLSSPFSTASRI